MNVNCPTCQTGLEAPESFVGKQVQCPRCRNVFTVQDPGMPRAYPPPLPSMPGDRGRERPAYDRPDYGLDPYGQPSYGPPPYGAPGYPPVYYRQPPPVDEAEGIRRAVRTGNLFLLAGAITLGNLVVFLIALVVGPLFDQSGGDRYVGQLLCAGLALALFLFPTGVCAMLGGRALKRLRGKALMTTAVVFQYILSTLAGFGLLILSFFLLAQVVNEFRREPEAPFLCFFWIAASAGTLLNLYAAIVGTVTLSNYHVVQCLDRAQKGTLGADSNAPS